MSNLRIQGHPNTSQRLKVIEDAIAAIQKDPIDALAQQYLGVKNYAGFGDQREDHNYGMGPKHGSIVFSVGRIDYHIKQTLGDSDIELLIKSRDFKPSMHKNENSLYNYSETVHRIELLEVEIGFLKKSIETGFNP